MKKIINKKLYPRTLLKEVEANLLKDNIIVVAGSRQVGKTSLLYLLWKKVKKHPKVYFDLEDISLLNDLNNLAFTDFPLYLQEKHNVPKKRKIYVFIDEIQYLENPASFLKYIYDHFKQIKLIVSGSSTLEIKKKFSDRLTGRKIFFCLHTLSFEEFLFFKKENFSIRKEVNFSNILLGQVKKIDKTTVKRVAWQEAKLSQLFEEFVLFGGYPKLVLERKRQDKLEILKEIHSTYVRKDIKDLSDIENIKAFNDLVDVLASQTANLLNLDELSNTLGTHRNTLEKYLFLLENTFIISQLKPFFTNKRKEITKMPKIYFWDTGLRNILLQDFNPLAKRVDKGSLTENTVFTEISKQKHILDNIYFWRTQTKTEVDFVVKREKEIVPIEVKYQEFTRPQVPSGLGSFIKAYSPKCAFVITKNFLAETKLARTKIFFLPIFLL